MPHKLSKNEYLSIVNNYEADALQNALKNESSAKEKYRRYNREPYGNEQAERSRFVSNDVQDVVEADMPSLVRTFLGAKKPIVFKPSTQNPEDIQEAKDKTDYIDWIVRGQLDSYRVQSSFLKEIEIQNLAALKFFIEDVKTKETIVRNGLTFEEIDEVEESLAGEDVLSVEIVDRSEISLNEGVEVVDITFEVVTKKREAKVCGVPIGGFLISSGAIDEDDANLIGECHTKTRGELVQEGFDQKLVAKLPMASNQQSLSNTKYNEDGTVHQDSFGDWANENVQVSDFLIKIDKDGSGSSERRHIIKSGDEILTDEPYELVNYVVASAILMPQTMVGKGRVEITEPSAELKTALVRGLLDNTYAHNAPQIGVNDNVNIDDLIIKRPNGLVRTKGDNNPGQSIMPINVSYIGGECLQVVQYADQARAQTTGSLLSSQGLSADTFEKETATRFNGVQDQSAAKIELVVRNIAETAYLRLYTGLAKLISIYQTTEVEIMVLGRPLKTNPADWKFKHSAKSTVGLGAGDGDKSSESLGLILSIQQQMQAAGSPLVDEVKIYNTVDSLLQSMDISDVGQYFNNPERPEQLLTAQNEIMTKMVQALQQQIQEMQNPLAEAETIRAKEKLVATQARAMIETQKLEENRRQFNIKTVQSTQQHDKDIAVDLTKIEAETNKNIDGALI
jgi:hypothetical protein